MVGILNFDILHVCGGEIWEKEVYKEMIPNY